MNLVEHQLRRGFGFWTGLFAVVASMVGTGIFLTSGYILQQTESPLTLLTLWILGGCLALCSALVYAELSTRFPQAGGEYVFLRLAFGRGFAFVYGWSCLLVGFSAPTAINALIAAKYVEPALYGLALYFKMPGRDILQHPIAAPCFATLLVVAISIRHCLGHRESANTQILTTILKLLTILALVLIGLAVGQGSWYHLTAGQGVGEVVREQPHLLAFSLIYVMYAYSGGNAAVYLAAELKEPAKHLPPCLLIGSGLVVLLYVLTNVGYIHAIAPTSLANLPTAEYEPVAKLAANRWFGEIGGSWASVVIGVGILATVSAYILTGPRVYYAMAQDGNFFAFAGRVNHSGVPVAATLTQMVVTLLMVWISEARQLLELCGLGLTIMSGMVVVSLFVLRSRRDTTPTGEPAFRMPLYPWPAILYVCFSFWMALSVLLQPQKRTQSLIGLGLIALGIPLYFLARSLRPPETQDPERVAQGEGI